MLGLAALVFVILCAGALLTRDANRLAEKKNLPETVDSIQSNKGIYAIAIVIIILLIFVLGVRIS